MTRFYIYALIDPRDLRVRYVGCSIRPKARLARARFMARNYPGDTPLYTWVRVLMDKGLTPTIVIIDETIDVDEARKLEQRWIGRFRARGKLHQNPGLHVYCGLKGPWTPKQRKAAVERHAHYRRVRERAARVQTVT